MMVRINLLPVRAVKKRESARQLLAFFALVLVAAGALNFLWYESLSSTRDRNAQRIAATEAEIAQLEAKIGEVNTLNARRAEVERKLKILEQLRKGRSGPVRMLDALLTATPKKVWLGKFTEKAGQVQVEGSALSHEDVADFMRQLSAVVWTPKGMGRLVEQRRDAKTSRVELLSQDAAVEEFPVGDIKPFFGNVVLQSTSADAAKSGNDRTTVKFRLAFAAAYAI